MGIFNFFGSILGYLLWGLYVIFKNYGIAIILFTIIVRTVMFPFSIKSQKSMAAQSRLAGKQKELQQRYANNQQKYNEENGIVPKTIIKKVHENIEITKAVETETIEEYIATEDIANEIEKLKGQMQAAAYELKFELAAKLRDRISELEARLSGNK